MLRTWILLCLAYSCSAADWSSLYDQSQLIAEQPRLKNTIDFVIQKEIQPFVPAQEATAFGLQAIEMPLNGFRSDPLDCYLQGRTIVLPIRTLLFVEDLARAYGWLWSNRLSTKTVDEYLSMLRYRNVADFPGSQFPAPLVALHIPGNALADSRVTETAVRLRRTADSFLLLHQFAHLQLHHQASSSKGYSAIQEDEADAYALNIMKENSVTPTGLLLLMYSSMFLEAGSGLSLHPVTPHRLEAMAHFLDGRVFEFIRGRTDKKAAMDGIHSIASLLVEGSEWLSVRGHQEELEQLAMKTNPGTLQPRPLPSTTK